MADHCQADAKTFFQMVQHNGQLGEQIEHTASMPAVLHVLQGEATVTFDDTVEAKPGTWVHMLTSLRHSSQAKTPVVMLLPLLEEPRP